MRQCYFCGATKDLKAIWIEDEIDDIGEPKKLSCCQPCFNENELDGYPVDRMEWAGTDYNWTPRQFQK